MLLGTQVSVFNTCRHIPRLEILDHIILLFLILWGPSILFYISVSPFYTPTNNFPEKKHMYGWVAMENMTDISKVQIKSREI